MAQRVEVLLTDDIDGSEASETVEFAYRGVQYEVDLSEKNAAALNKALTKYVEAARRVGRTSRGKGARHVPTGMDNASVRAWAQANGYEVSERGRIKAEIVEAYRAAGN